MIANVVAAALLILSSVSASPMTVTKQVATRATPQPNLIGGQDDDTAILDRVASVLSASGYAGILAYSGECQKGDGSAYVAFPKIDLHPAQSNVPLQAMRQIFRGNANLTVTAERHKVISITIGAPVTAVLKTRISMLRLVPLARYNPFMVIGAIEASKEVSAEMARLNLHTPPLVLDVLLQMPMKGVPHVPHVIKNVSVKKALSLIATTFNGMIVYGTCTWPDGSGLLDIYFTGLDP